MLIRLNDSNKTIIDTGIIVYLSTPHQLRFERTKMWSDLCLTIGAKTSPDTVTFMEVGYEAMAAKNTKEFLEIENTFFQDYSKLKREIIKNYERD